MKNMIRMAKVLMILMIVLTAFGCSVESKGEGGETSTVVTSNNPIPQNVRSLGKTISSTQIGWNSIANATSYRVYRSNDQITFTFMEEYTSSSCEINGLGEGDSFFIRVTSMINEVESDPSTVLKVSSAITSPAGYMIQKVNGDFTAVKLTWSAVGTANYYKVFRADNNSSSEYELLEKVLALEYTNDDLSDGGTYYYKLIAYKDDDITSNEQVIEYTCSQGAVTGIKVNDAFFDQMVITWDVNSSPSVDGYYVRRDADLNGSFEVVARLQSNSINNYCDDEKSLRMPFGQKYFYKIQSFSNKTDINNSGFDIAGDISGAYEGITQPLAPLQPATTSESITSTSAVLKWQAPSTGVYSQGAYIYRSQKSNPIADLSDLGGAKAPLVYTSKYFTFNKYPDTGLGPNGRYVYYLTSYIGYTTKTDVYKLGYYMEITGPTAYSLNIINVRTLPPTPTTLQVTFDGGNDATCSWVKPDDTDVMYLKYQYIIQYKETSASSWSSTPIITNENDCDQDILNLKGGTSYMFSLMYKTQYAESADPSQNEAYVSGKEQILYATSSLKPPASVTLSNTCNYMSLTWSKVSAVDQTVYYDVYKSANGGASYSLINYADYLYDENSTTITIHDTDVSFGTNYKYYVIAYVIEPISGTRTNSTAKYSGAVAHVVPVPGFIDAQCIASNGGIIDLKWNKVTDVDSYILTRSPAFPNDPITGLPEIYIMDYNTTSYQDTGLTKNVSYTYSIKANKGGFFSALDITNEIIAK